MSLEMEIEPQALSARLENGKPLLLVAVREPWEYDLCRLPGAVLIPLGELAARLQELLAADELVLYCHHGRRSLDAAAWLRQQGADRARSLAGGIDRWAREIDPKTPRY